jgi:transcriptional regulator with AAA-type ATPase domain
VWFQGNDGPVSKSVEVNVNDRDKILTVKFLVAKNSELSKQLAQGVILVVADLLPSKVLLVKCPPLGESRPAGEPSK